MSFGASDRNGYPTLQLYKWQSQLSTTSIINAIDHAQSHQPSPRPSRNLNPHHHDPVLRIHSNPQTRPKRATVQASNHTFHSLHGHLRLLSRPARPLRSRGNKPPLRIEITPQTAARKREANGRPQKPPYSHPKPPASSSMTPTSPTTAASIPTPAWPRTTSPIRRTSSARGRRSRLFA